MRAAFPTMSQADLDSGLVKFANSLRFARPRNFVPAADFAIRGQIQCSVVNGRTGEVVREYPVQKNLILNRFMEDLYDRQFNRMFSYAVASIGTTATLFDSGATEASQTGTTVTINTGTGAFRFDDTFNHAGSCVGNIIKWDSGEERRIISRTSSSVVEVTATSNGNVPQGPFSVYGTNQYRMADHTNSERAGGAISGTSWVNGECGTTNSAGGTCKLFRTYDFAVRADSLRVSSPYTEIGFSDQQLNATSSGQTINSRIVLASPVPVASGFLLRVKYELTITVSPITPQVVSGTPITGWTSAGVQQLQSLAMLETVSTSGSSSGSASPLEPCDITVNGTVATLSGSLAAHNTYGSNGPSRVNGGSPSVTTLSDHTDTTLTKSTKLLYTDTVNAVDVSRLFLDKNASWGPSVGNSIGGKFGSICLGTSGAGGIGALGATNQAFVFVMNVDNQKDSLHQLDIAFRFSWSRTLS